eukprot:5772713-Lingulodinium_polyedra.AAC.1
MKSEMRRWPCSSTTSTGGDDGGVASGCTSAAGCAKAATSAGASGVIGDAVSVTDGCDCCW